MKGHYKKRNCTCEPKKCTCDKTWTYWVDLGRDPKTGERRQTSKGGFRTKKEAEAAVAAIVNEVNQGTFFIESNIKFMDFADLWLPMYIERTSPKPGTIRIRKYGIKKLLPYFAHIKLKNITEEMYQEALNDLCKELSLSTLQGIHSTGRMIFEMACRRKLIKEDPSTNGYINKEKETIIESGEETIDDKNQEIEATKRNYLDLENQNDIDLPKYFEKQELKIFLNAAKEHGRYLDEVIFTVLAYTGMRIGELIALKWKDIDFHKYTININKTYYNEKNNTKQYVLVPPKTKKSKRKVAVADLVIEKLKKHKEEQQKIINRLGDSYRNRDFIFTNVNRHHGYPILTKLVENRMNRLLKKVNLNSTLTPHSLRHTHTSLLAEAKVGLEDIKDRLGHFDDVMTRRIYLHITDPVKREASDKFKDFMDS